MSVKAQALVWDIECPSKINEIDFKPNHKYVLVAYADHADHNGKNIFPAVRTISKKTGLEERTVQRMTHELRRIGLLIEDGKGPRGTNRWALPYSERGDSLTPVRGDSLTPVTETGVRDDESLGDNSSGDNSSGDAVTPEFKELNQELINNISNDVFNSWEALKAQIRTHFKKAEYQTWIEPTSAVRFEDKTLNVASMNEYARQWLDKNLKELAQIHLGVYVKFLIPDLVGERMGRDD